MFYVAADSRMMAVPMQLPPNGEVLEIGSPVPLFTVRLAAPSNLEFGYIVDPAAQRFLVAIAADQTSTAPITVIQNWTASLPR